MLNEVLVHFDTSLLLRRSLWILRERASGFINSLISSPVRPEGERCTAFALGLPRSPVHRIEISSERDRGPGMAAIKIQRGNFDAANRRVGRREGKDGLTNCGAAVTKRISVWEPKWT